MSLIPTISEQSTEVIEDVELVENAATAQTPILITQQEVVFSTAASIPPRPVRTAARRWIDAMRRAFAATADPHPHGRPYQPRRYSFLEAACMAREMERL